MASDIRLKTIQIMKKTQQTKTNKQTKPTTTNKQTWAIFPIRTIPQTSGHSRMVHRYWSSGWKRNSSIRLPSGIDPTTHRTINGRKEGNVLFNDALNTFYLRLYGVRHMVKDHSDSERGNPLPPHRLLFPINSKDSFICIIPQTG